MAAPTGAPGRERSSGHKGVAEIQRSRILGSMMVEVAEHGVGRVTVAHVVARSGVSRRTFYEQFADLQECLLAAFDDVLARLEAVAVPAFEQGGSWRAGVRNARIASSAFLEGDPASARLLVVESLGGGPEVLRRRQRAISRIAEIVDRGREQSKSSAGAPPLSAEGIVGGVLSVLHARICETGPEDPVSMVDLAGPLMGMIVLPYMGAVAARKEIDRPVPQRDTGTVRLERHDPFHGLRMRLTYRTVRVLMVVAEHPGCSNRTVADGAGIGDQGQTSKLLARLQNLGLIANTGAGPERGAPNEWTLTARGREVHEAVAQEASA